MQSKISLRISALAIALLSAGLVQAAVSPEQAARLNKDLHAYGRRACRQQGRQHSGVDRGLHHRAGRLQKRRQACRPLRRRQAVVLGDRRQHGAVRRPVGRWHQGLAAEVSGLPARCLSDPPQCRRAAVGVRQHAEERDPCQPGGGDRKSQRRLWRDSFPLPQNGAEVLWNYRLSWQGADTFYSPFDTWLMTAGGKKIQATRARFWYQNPYYFKEGSLETFGSKFLIGKLATELPSSKAGEGLMTHWDMDPGKRAAWQYLVGQRRVRRTPNIAYDTPDFVTSGVGFFDEAFMVFGPTDRHDLKLVGKKELLVPYNNNRAAAAKSDDLVKPNFLNPDLVRWEKHRVWVVSATLKDGKRHVVPKRTYYVDEDSWQVLLVDGYDAQGKLGRHNYSLTLLAPEMPAADGPDVVGQLQPGNRGLLPQLVGQRPERAVPELSASTSGVLHPGRHGQRQQPLSLGARRRGCGFGARGRAVGSLFLGGWSGQ
uniref:Uncharacterized protein rpsC n=1 Tax=Pseudomonas fluorescens TaxID=294 RepID=Q75QJ3_PSEFL|nr:hypothetical protein [Pseudomonas fluorescens]